jgi:hypothetical protein
MHSQVPWSRQVRGPVGWKHEVRSAAQHSHHLLERPTRAKGAAS